ncbi:ECF transporter S component [Ructibacterium gallinarum]|uniref:Riboflavin transporter n=1 Tax=Ructibacterium gallinarum TaxID=2779355 RepID=A0A9D5M0P9_9FIRM|nr:ECF transporter S component [Ructibacterium gallinarum]MBE5039996.1 ECF transporter S component [Ructibacterium gallinarum]
MKTSTTTNQLAAPSNTRRLVTIAVASAVSFVLMLLEFHLPIAPDFIKLDFSDLPSVILAFTFGPLAGACTELIKNLLHLFITKTGGVGELSNFLLGCAFVIPAGLIYKKHKTRKTALLAMLVGTLCFSIMGILSNYYIMFPFYTKVSGIPMEAIIGMCQKILPFVDNQWKVILLSVTPFNLLKGILVSVVTFLLYKRLSPILHGISKHA